jgi:hypothetical protein
MQGRMLGDVFKKTSYFLSFMRDKQGQGKKNFQHWKPLNWFTLGPVKMITLTK